MFMHGFFKDIRQDINIGQASAKASSAAARADEVQRLMEQKIDKLSMVVQALWSFIRENHAASEEDLMNRVRDIDMQDGVLDGKVAKGGAKQCRSCGRVMNRMHNKCLYCGTDGLNETMFESL